MKSCMCILVLLCLSGCFPADNSKRTQTANNTPQENQADGNQPSHNPEPETTEETALQKLREDVAAVAARSELSVDQIEVQHLLVSFKGSGVDGVTRNKEEAEQVAADLYKRILAGEDFDGLVKEHTDDAHPGIYGMTMVGSGNQRANLYPRKGMVAAFGDVGWRLQVGEVGVAPFDAAKSPYGWHIIKRTK